MAQNGKPGENLRRILRNHTQESQGHSHSGNRQLGLVEEPSWPYRCNQRGFPCQRRCILGPDEAPVPRARHFTSPRLIMPVEVVNSVDQFREIINGGDTVVFDFWATWCGPCRTMSPIFEELSEKKSGVKFYKVDTDEQQEIIQEAGLRAMPTFIAWRKGEKIGDVVGANPGGLESLISSL